MKVIDREEPDLTFVQEPYEYQNGTVGIVKKCRIFTAGNGKHRLAIVMPNKEITPWSLHRYQTKAQYV